MIILSHQPIHIGRYKYIITEVIAGHQEYGLGLHVQIPHFVHRADKPAGDLYASHPVGKNPDAFSETCGMCMDSVTDTVCYYLQTSHFI